MLVKVKGKEQSIKDLEEIINLLEEAKKNSVSNSYTDRN